MGENTIHTVSPKPKSPPNSINYLKTTGTLIEIYSIFGAIGFLLTLIYLKPVWKLSKYIESYQCLNIQNDL